ncbi:MAG: helix-turn-helix domain-containing protein [Flavobacteriaceae bacterium]
MITFQNPPIRIGSRLRKLRLEKGYKQEYIADVLKVSQKTYSNMENDKTAISLDTLKKIAEEYKIDLLDLLTPDTPIIQNNTAIENSTFQSGIIINQLSEELINQIKERVEDLKQIIIEKDKRIALLEHQKR